MAAQKSHALLAESVVDTGCDVEMAWCLAPFTINETLAWAQVPLGKRLSEKS
jgi:hypothetical protein